MKKKDFIQYRKEQRKNFENVHKSIDKCFVIACNLAKILHEDKNISIPVNIKTPYGTLSFSKEPSFTWTRALHLKTPIKKK